MKPARTSMPSGRTASAMLLAHRTARAGPSYRASRPSPAESTNTPWNRSSSGLSRARRAGRSSPSNRASAHSFAASSSRADDVREQHGAGSTEVQGRTVRAPPPRSGGSRHAWAAGPRTPSCVPAGSRGSFLGLRLQCAPRCSPAGLRSSGVGEHQHRRLHGGEHPGDVPSHEERASCSSTSKPVVVGRSSSTSPMCPREVSERYPDADRELLGECRMLVLAMVAAWRCDPGDRFPNGQRAARKLLNALHGHGVLLPEEHGREASPSTWYARVRAVCGAARTGRRVRSIRRRTGRPRREAYFEAAVRFGGSGH